MLRVRKFSSIDELELFLQGAVLGSKPVPAWYPGIVGKTLIFSKPSAVTVTFVTANNQIDPTSLTFAAVKAQIESAFANAVIVGQRNSVLFIRQTTPVSGGGVNITGGTGRNELGLSESATHVGQVYDVPGGIAPTLVQTYAWTDGSHVLITQE